MNIVRLCPVYHPYFEHGGSVVADYELDKAMVKEGHKLTVVTCRRSLKKKHKEALNDRHSVLYFFSLGNIIYGFSLGPLIWLFLKCLRKDNDIDIVWFGGVWNLLSIVGPLICKFFSIKYIISPHGMLIPHLIDLKSSRIKALVIKFFHKSNLKNAYKVHFTVTEEFNETSRAIKTEINPLIFPLFFDLQKFDIDLKDINQQFFKNKITLSFIGRITPKKRIDLIFKALQILPDGHKEKIRFNVIGPDAENIWQKSQYNKEKTGVEINYYGALYHKELIEAYKECDVFILCSESENFAISVIEAAYSYSAILISQEVGVSEYFSQENAFFSSAKYDDICSSISWIIENKELIYNYKLAAREVSEQFESSHLKKDYFKNLLS